MSSFDDLCSIKREVEKQSVRKTFLSFSEYFTVAHEIWSKLIISLTLIISLIQKALLEIVDLALRIVIVAQCHKKREAR